MIGVCREFVVPETDATSTIVPAAEEGNDMEKFDDESCIQCGRLPFDGEVCVSCIVTALGNDAELSNWNGNI